MIIYSGACLCMCMHNVYTKIVYRSLMDHSISNKQGILGHLSDFDETYCVCSTYGAHHPYQLDHIHHIVSDLWPQIFWIFYEKSVH